MVRDEMMKLKLQWRERDCEEVLRLKEGIGKERSMENCKKGYGRVKGEYVNVERRQVSSLEEK